MTKLQAIEQAREFIKADKQFNPTTQKWEAYVKPLEADTRHDLKNRRIIYTLELIGTETSIARAYAYKNSNVPFRDAIYKFKK